MYMVMCFLVFFFKQKTAYDMRISDWSSDVCSSDLTEMKLGDAGLHLGLVGLRPFELRRCGRVLVEGIGIGVDQDAARLPLDQPLEQPLELRILRDEMDIRLHLRRAVAQPHRLDIAGDDESVGAAVERPRDRKSTRLNSSH